MNECIFWINIFLMNQLILDVYIYRFIIYYIWQISQYFIYWKHCIPNKFFITKLEYHLFDIHIALSTAFWRVYQFSSVIQLYPTLCNPMDCSTPGFPVLHQLLELTQTYVHIVGDAIQPSHPLSSPFCSCLQSFPAPWSFPMSQFFISGGQSIGTSASASVLPVNIQDWFPLGWTGWISLQSKGLSRVFSNTKVQKHQFFSVQLFLWSNSHIRKWLLEKP